MDYRGVELSVVQGLGRDLWRWYLTINGVWLSGEPETQFAAVVEAQKAIDLAISRGPVRDKPK
jgi:hypothetical protein